MKYILIHAQWLKGKMKEEVISEFDNKKEAARSEDFLRKAYKCDTTIEDFYVKEVEE